MDDATEDRFDALHRQSRWGAKLRAWFAPAAERPVPEEMRALLDRLDDDVRSGHRNEGRGRSRSERG